MLETAESKAELNGLDVDSLVIGHSQVNKSPTTWHRTSRAQGRINPYMSSPCHIEMIRTEKEQTVPKPEEEVAQKKKRNLNFSHLTSKLKSCVMPPTGSQTLGESDLPSSQNFTGHRPQEQRQRKGRPANAGGVSGRCLRVTSRSRQPTRLSAPRNGLLPSPRPTWACLVPQEPRTSARSTARLQPPIASPSPPLPLPSSCSLYLRLRFRHGRAGESHDTPGNERKQQPGARRLLGNVVLASSESGNVF
ncbi:hypothetical protein J1605_013352 [Eschrichtius robustus]|uniref:Large ribosomal subunit protein uL22 n=1 Tax=Eschrichtius robustus TaxID=9764 RepID=A0AB34GIY1_ESCRO|nr:hypothetical protein J1605_013352 [Eschrichtius robustus]